MQVSGLIVLPFSTLSRTLNTSRFGRVQIVLPTTRNEYSPSRFRNSHDGSLVYSTT